MRQIKTCLRGFLTKRDLNQYPQLKIENLLVASLDMILSNKRITMVLIRLRVCAGWFAPLLFANTKDRFSHVEAKYIVCIVKTPKALVMSHMQTS